MDALLLTAVDPFSYQVTPDLGLLYLASFLREAGLSVAAKDFRRERRDYKRLPDLIRKERPPIVGVKCYSHEVGRVRDTARLVRKAHPSATIVIGGPHPSMDPEGALCSIPEADYVFLGESEWTFTSFAKWLVSDGDGEPPEDVRGIACRGDSGTILRPPVFESDLGRLLMPAWDLMPPHRYPDEAPGMYVPAFPSAPMMLSRGCPFHCAYCGACYVMGERIRYRPVENIIEEIDYLESEFGVRSFTFVDDNFTASRERSSALFEALAKRRPRVAFTFPNGVRVGTLDKDIIKLMEAAGCSSLALGIESGSDQTLERMNKKQTTDEVKRAVDLIRKNTRIRVTGFFMLGYPGEVEDDIRKTVEFASSLPIHHPHFCVFTPIPGTPAYRELVEQGWAPADPERLTFDKAPFQPPGVSRKKLIRLHQYAYLKFYAKPWRLLNLAREIRSPGHAWSLVRRAIKLLG